MAKKENFKSLRLILIGIMTASFIGFIEPLTDWISLLFLEIVFIGCAIACIINEKEEIHNEMGKM